MIELDFELNMFSQGLYLEKNAKFLFMIANKFFWVFDRGCGDQSRKVNFRLRVETANMREIQSATFFLYRNDRSVSSLETDCVIFHP